MKRLTKEDIENINNKVSDKWDHGIFVQPTYIPTDIKGEVCFMRWHSAGRGGSCWDDENTVNEDYYYDRPLFDALNLVLSHYEVDNHILINEIQSMIKDEDDAGSYHGYYGDYDEYKAAWIELETIYECLNKHYLMSGQTDKLIG